ncbi:hypothetical protein RB195_001482 [Necator americanus]|uniref:Glycosyltransferase family 92 protein n=1 Tax=Necator americanus TaxID=51031 RepID=A0ABR1DEW9_NECAM
MMIVTSGHDVSPPIMSKSSTHRRGYRRLWLNPIYKRLRGFGTRTFRRQFVKRNPSISSGDTGTRKPEDREAYLSARREAKKAVAAKSHHHKALYDMLDTREEEWAVYRLVRARHHSTLDREHTKIVKGVDGAVLRRSGQILERWQEYYNHLCNEEFCHLPIPTVPSVEGPVLPITAVEVSAALTKMKSNKATGLDDILVDVWKLLGDRASVWVATLFNKIVAEGRTPDLANFRDQTSTVLEGSAAATWIAPQCIKNRVHGVRTKDRGWQWKVATGVLYDKKVPVRLKSKIYRTVERPVALYGCECWPATKALKRVLHATEMRMLMWTITLKDKVSSDTARSIFGVVPKTENMMEARLKCLGARGKFCCQNRSEARRFRREAAREAKDSLVRPCEAGYDSGCVRLMQWIEPNGRQEAERQTLQQRGTNARKKKTLVGEVLDFYKRKLDKDLEIILWSDLPVRERDRFDYKKDPNSRVFRHAAITFMHECMLRARSHVKFIANFDLDDFPVAENLNIPEVLDRIDKENKNIAEIVVDWKLTRQRINWESLRTPSDIRFMLPASRLIADDSIRYDYRISKKMFARPERVAVFDMHNIYRNELIPGKTKQYGYIYYSSPKLFLLHMRRFQRNLINDDIRYNTTISTRFLVALNRSMMMSFKKRLQFDEFAAFQMAPWATEAIELLRNLEQCRKEAFGMMLTDENRMCQQSSGGCEPMLTTRSTFIRAPISWVDLAHTAHFNNYTVPQKH